MKERPTIQPSPTLSRRHGPGSKWAYVKIYAGEPSADRILTNVIAPLVASLAESGWSDRWHFLRYHDDAPHLRVRFHCSESRFSNRMWRAIDDVTRHLVEDGIAWRVATDTYDQEVHRYGGPSGIEFCEKIFCADSRAVLRLVQSTSAFDDTRWLAALRGVDELLGDFGLSLDERLRFAEERAESIGVHFHLTGGGLHHVKSRFREARPRVLEALQRDGMVPTCLAERSQVVTSVVESLRRREAAGDLNQATNDLLSSIVHLHVNRMMPAHQNAQEAVLYRYLALAYRSRVARRGQPVPASESPAPPAGERIREPVLSAED